jgi:hypothetical protein
LIAGIERYKSAVADRWHTPGHKGLLWADDITEIDGGGFLFPDKLTEQAEARAAAVYKAKK